MPDGLANDVTGPAPSACGHRWASDDALLADLREAVAGAGALPEPTLQAARGALSWRSLRVTGTGCGHAWSRTGPGVPTRGDEPPPRTLTFVAAPLGIEVELLRSRVVGQVIPPGTARVTLETPGGDASTVETDELGFFVFTSRPRGPVRFVCDTETARLRTEWIDG